MSVRWRPSTRRADPSARPVFYWTDGSEVDFVVDDHGEVDLVNVCMGDEIPDREWRSVLSHPKPARRGAQASLGDSG